MGYLGVRDTEVLALVWACFWVYIQVTKPGEKLIIGFLVAK